MQTARSKGSAREGQGDLSFSPRPRLLWADLVGKACFQQALTQEATARCPVGPSVDGVLRCSRKGEA